MKSRHQETLCQVIQMLPHCQDIVPFPPGTSVETAPLHPRTETANRVAFGQRTGLLQNPCIGLQVYHDVVVHSRSRCHCLVLRKSTGPQGLPSRRREDGDCTRATVGPQSLLPFQTGHPINLNDWGSMQV